MPKKQTTFPLQTVQVAANHLFTLLEELRDLREHEQLNGDLRKIVADAWLYIGAIEEQGVVPEGFSDFHRYFVQQARMMEQKKQNPLWSDEDMLRFKTMLWAAADTPASLRPMDVGRVFENAKNKQADEEQLRQWLLMQPDLVQSTRRVLETGLYRGRKIFLKEDLYS
ncbi:MAG: hypothetical protein H0U76_22175 [Ktedonobacteraceae bacterium]|nr:hypothetical protein [Ktedonobacteraceae bacterium]